MNRHVLITAAAAAALIAVGGLATAAIPGPGGEIHGCYAAETGQVRLVEDAASCRRSETAISWSQTGPRGETGAPGPTGPAGATGPQGEPGAAASVAGITASDDYFFEPIGPAVRRVLTKRIPEGRYIVQATVSTSVHKDTPVTEPRDPQIGCSLEAPGYHPAMAWVTVANTMRLDYFRGDAQVSLSGAITLEAEADVAIECALSDADWMSVMSEMTLVRVDTLD